VPNGVRDGRIEPYRFSGDVAQLARAPRLQRGGRGFEPHRLHIWVCESLGSNGFDRPEAIGVEQDGWDARRCGPACPPGRNCVKSCISA
jgi:hypothetical protein